MVEVERGQPSHLRLHEETQISGQKRHSNLAGNCDSRIGEPKVDEHQVLSNLPTWNVNFFQQFDLLLENVTASLMIRTPQPSEIARLAQDARCSVDSAKDFDELG
jgi:hypothetical protein